MPPKTTTTSNKPATGRIIINACEILNPSAIEITPGGNGFYAVTIRQILTEQPPQMFRETYKGELHIIYLHPALQDMRLLGNFLDFGIQDEDGKVMLSLFFKAQQDEPQLQKLPAHTGPRVVQPQIKLV
jgi:hypothetical protein